LQKSLDKSRTPDISFLLDKLELLEDLEKKNEGMKKEVGRFKGLPAVSSSSSFCLVRLRKGDTEGRSKN